MSFYVKDLNKISSNLKGKLGEIFEYANKKTSFQIIKIHYKKRKWYQKLIFWKKNEILGYDIAVHIKN